MNTKFAILALAAFAATTTDAASTAPCPSSELAKLAGLASSQNVFPCQAVSGGFNMIPPSGPPTAEQRAKMCAAPVCHALLKEIVALNPTDCVLSLGNLNVNELANGFEASCAAASSPAPAVAPAVTPAPATSTPAAPGTPSTTAPATGGAPAPAATTVKPAC
uniref:Elicitin n=1 Tax=Globisporangium ultimum (strain ATCC 200006 / CBS 805.95 / DAOM BR144) TaxID=431595 RepID=K3WTY6_GLOUD